MAFDWALALLVIGIICGVFLIVMALLGGLDMGADFDTDVDVDTDVGLHIGTAAGPNPLGIPTILAVLSLFGLSGYVVTTIYGIGM